MPRLAGLIARLEQLPAIQAAAGVPAAPADIFDDVAPSAAAVEQDKPAISATSAQVAERLGVPHWRVLEKIRKLLVNDGVAAANMIETTYLDDGRKRPSFDLTRHGVWLLASSTRGAAAAALRDEFAVDAKGAAAPVSLAPVVDKTDSFYRIGLAEGFAAGLREGRAAGYADGANDAVMKLNAALARSTAAAGEVV